MSTLKEQIAAIITPLQLSAVATIAEGKPWVRYVMTVGGDDLSMRFATYAQSRKVAQIVANPEVHVTLGVNEPNDSTGRASNESAGVSDTGTSNMGAPVAGDSSTGTS